jgi:hypothetical protein
MSTSGPVYCLACSSSGAAKYKLPQKVFSKPFGEKRLLKPKSMILMSPVLLMRMFSIFRSLCTILFRWQ